MIKHNEIFYIILSSIVLIICVLIFYLATDPTFYMIASLLLGLNILLIFHLYLFRNKLQKFEITSKQALLTMKEDLEEACIKKTEDLEESYQRSIQRERQLQDAFESAIQGMALISLEGSFISVNSSLCDIIGYNEKDLLRTDLQCITHPDEYEKDRENMQKLLTGEITSYKLEKRLYHVEGLTAWVLQNMKLARNQDSIPIHFVVHFIDITERKQAENQLKKYTETLTVLLREVNHRVKNNLAALISMLHMEQNKALANHNEEYVNFLNDLISRIQSLSTVHSMLSAQNWQPLEISKLCSLVMQAAIQGTPLGKKVNIQVSPVNIKVNSNQAHHLTLVINELTTNSIKHAIHNRLQAMINVDISTGEGFINLKFKDDGPGFPQSLIDGDFSHANIGFELIRGIVRQSLDGEFRLENNNGATAIIRFQNELEEK